jgi:nucleotidyltransferase/DNA polymerase involved in DNA repair
MGIYSALDLYHAPYALLKQHFGANGEAWYLRLRGFEVDLKPTTRRMIGHQITITPQPASDRAHVMSVASQITYRVATRLRTAGLAARGIVVWIRFNDRTWWKKVYHGRQAFTDSANFYKQVERMIGHCRLEKPVRLVSVSVIDLVEQAKMTLPLINEHARDNRISAALDEINFRYGESSIMTARQLTSGKLRDAIGYGNATQNVRELPK